MPKVHKIKLIIVQPLLEAIATMTPVPGTNLCSRLLFLSVMITSERELWSIPLAHYLPCQGRYHLTNNTNLVT